MWKSFVLTAALLTGSTTYLCADDTKPTTATNADKAAVAPAHRSSKITGMTVKNGNGKDLGTINDLVIDMKTGQIRYAAVSYGGFLGLGDKLFAVPWKAFEARHSPDASSYHLILKGVSEADLKNAPGFDQNNWPDFGDQKWKDEVDKFYKITHTESDRPAVK